MRIFNDFLDLLSYCPEWALDWSYRRDKLLDDITQYSPDILCLQEIEKQVFETEFKQYLSQACLYDSIYSQKGRAKTMPREQQEHVDGCAIFYNHQNMRPVLVSKKERKDGFYFKLSWITIQFF